MAAGVYHAYGDNGVNELKGEGLVGRQVGWGDCRALAWAGAVVVGSLR